MTNQTTEEVLNKLSEYRRILEKAYAHIESLRKDLRECEDKNESLRTEGVLK